MQGRGIRISPMSSSEQARPTVRVVPAAPADRERAAGVLAEAFATDEHTIGLLPAGDRPARLRRMFSGSVTGALRAGGHVWLAEDPVDRQLLGVALWYGPGASTSVARRAGALAGALRTHGGRIGDALVTEAAAGRHRPQVPHWYLAAIGIATDAQGRGAASALIRHRLAAADAGGHGTYLESSKTANVPIYERYGFAEISTIPARGTAPLIGMWRPAQL